MEYNNWRVVDLVATNITLEEEEKIYEIILHWVEAKINKMILLGPFDAIRTNDEAT